MDVGPFGTPGRFKSALQQNEFCAAYLITFVIEASNRITVSPGLA
jgi:hypothetical protein